MIAAGQNQSVDAPGLEPGTTKVPARLRLDECERLDSNQEPPRYKLGALTIELRSHNNEVEAGRVILAL